MNKIINLIISIIALIGTIIAIYMITLKLTGHSPTLEQTNLTIIGIISSIILSTQLKLGKFEEFMEQNKSHNKEIKQDINELKDFMFSFDKRLSLIEQRINYQK